MSLTQEQKDALNEWSLSEPALKRGTLIGVDALNMGDLLDRALASQIIKGEALDSAATTVVSSLSNVLLGDLVTAVITLPNTGGSIATGLDAAVTADGEITITPNVTPTNADGIIDLIITRPQST